MVAGSIPAAGALEKGRSVRTRWASRTSATGIVAREGHVDSATPSEAAITWPARLAVKDTGLSSRMTRVRIPSGL